MATTTDIADRIKGKATEMFLQYGLRSVSMDDIASNLGISKKTIYQYFTDKDSLVDNVITSVINNNKACCEADTDCSENAIHEIFIILEFQQQIFNSINPGLLFDMKKYHPGAFQKFSEHKNKYVFGMLKANILRGIGEGLYREDLKVDLLAKFKVEAIFLTFDPEFQKAVNYSIDKIEEEILLNFLFGMVSEKGYKLAINYKNNSIKYKINDEK